MAFSRRNDGHEPDIWPGFVDALSTVLLVFTFVLVGFISSQVYLSSVILDKDSTLSRAQSELSRMCVLLDAEKGKTVELSKENYGLASKIAELTKSIAELQALLGNEREVRTKTQDEVGSLKEKIEELSEELKKVFESLASERKELEGVKKENLKLSELSKLSAFRSEFFDKLQHIVKDKKNIKIAGDRFIFQSELFFDTASSELSVDGVRQLSELAGAVKEIAGRIPKGIKWILRVDGHTDKRPIAGKFQSNWELSAARAISVVKFLADAGIPPEHLVAAGFGEHQPMSDGSGDEDLSKNRRIEFKLDER